MSRVMAEFYKLVNEGDKLNKSDPTTYDYILRFYEEYMEIIMPEGKLFLFIKRKQKHLKIYYDEIIGMHIYNTPYMEIEMEFRSEMRSDMCGYVNFDSYLTGIDQDVVDFLNSQPRLMSEFYCENSGLKGKRREKPLITPGKDVREDARKNWFLDRARQMGHV